MNVFHNGAIYIGGASMFAQLFGYFLEIVEVDETSFKFKHKLTMDNLQMMVDEKEGNGSWVKVDENIIRLEFNDPETNFVADLNINSGELKGEATQAIGFFIGSKGTIDGKYENKLSN
jgi:hypothetical protein